LPEGAFLFACSCGREWERRATGFARVNTPGNGDGAAIAAEPIGKVRRTWVEGDRIMAELEVDDPAWRARLAGPSHGCLITVTVAQVGELDPAVFVGLPLVDRTRGG
jgi:hypothetical protein